jgi:hypothetical protein
MTDIASRPLSDAQIDALVHYDAARDEIADLRRRLADAETERNDHAATIKRAIDALAAEHAETARVAAEVGDDPDQYAAMLLTGQRNGAHRAYALVLRATLTYGSVDEAARRIAEGTAWGQTDAPQYGPDGFTPLCEIGPF